MQTASVPALEMVNVSVGYGGTDVLAGVSASIHSGAYVAVVGPNGAGKSTLFKAIVGLIAPHQGDVLVYGRRAGRHDRRVAYIPQRDEIDWSFPVSVLDVVLMGRFGRLGWLRHPGREDRIASMRCLEKVGIDDLAHQPIGSLSGGQQQRVFFARALAQEPEILVLDEPFSGVDAPTKEIALNVLDDLHAQGVTVLVSTHDLALAASRPEHLMLLNRRLVAFGVPSQVLTTSALSSTFGDQVFVYKTGDEFLAVADYCCPPSTGAPTEGKRRGR